ncbi:TPM domain-containing protein [Halioxenophilus aromaticivorans]|uniref:TPM domain-containing protein n=1 Tax=Halioxenophilus aromaticivorans TaxID=1306992 RepID=A0AAV3TXS0_9ALTE
MNGIAAMRGCLLFVFVLSLCSKALAEIDFPPLTGRVVDQAGMISAQAEQRIDQQLALLEKDTTVQLVVVTAPSLNGLTIESYGYQLGRHWGIGTKAANNGVLLIAAKQERRVRIEVGYGLEGMLTDALTANIIHQLITPEFKRGRFDEGFIKGVTAIGQLLQGDYQPVKPNQDGDKKKKALAYVILIIMLVIVFSSLGNGGGRGGRSRRHIPGYGGYSGGGYRSGGFGGGGFSGGGGSFGGGGASGGW